MIPVLVTTGHGTRATPHRGLRALAGRVARAQGPGFKPARALAVMNVAVAGEAIRRPRRRVRGVPAGWKGGRLMTGFLRVTVMWGVRRRVGTVTAQQCREALQDAGRRSRGGGAGLRRVRWGAAARTRRQRSSRRVSSAQEGRIVKDLRSDCLSTATLTSTAAAWTCGCGIMRKSWLSAPRVTQRRSENRPRTLGG